MRKQLLLMLSVLPLLAMACDRTVSRNGDRGPECVAEDNKKDTCDNLLPDRWEYWKELDSAQLADLGGRLAKMKPGGGASHKPAARLVADCPAYPNGRLDVDYTVPQALKKLPSTSTGSRWLVVAFFAADTSGPDCPEILYRFRKDNAGGKREEQFIAVRLTGLPDKAQGKVAVGEWRSVALIVSQGKYRLEQLRSGVFFSCHRKKDELSKDDLDFRECPRDGRHTAMADARDVIPVDLRITRNALALLDPRVVPAMTLQDTLGSNRPENSPAWGRCGNLGCCASEL